MLAIPGTAVVTPLWYWLVQREELGRLTMLFFLVPVFGLALAALIYGERISLVEGVGIALILAAMGFVLSETQRTVGRSG